MHEQVRELVAEGLRLFACKVAVLDSPVRDRVNDASDQLAHAALAAVAAERSAEVLRDDDVRRCLRPRVWDLDVLLLEERVAALVGDDRRAQLPLDCCEWIVPGD